jgi:hypothetical protein
LKNFHAASYNLSIIPIVIATNAVSGGSKIVWSADGVAQAVPSNGVALGALIKEVARDQFVGIDVDSAMWVTGGYKPTPTVIEAAQAAILWNDRQARRRVKKGPSGAERLGLRGRSRYFRNQ